MVELQYNEEAQATLESTLKKIESVLKRLDIQLSNFSSAVTGELKGEAATELAQAIEKKRTRIKETQTSWTIAIENAKEIEQIMIEMDSGIAKKYGPEL